MAREGILFQDIVASTGRVFAGFLLATLVAVPIGIGMGVYPSHLRPLRAADRHVAIHAGSGLYSSSDHLPGHR